MHCDGPKDSGGQCLDPQAGPRSQLKDQGGGVQQECLVGADSHEDEEEWAEAGSSSLAGAARDNQGVPTGVQPDQGSQGQVVDKGDVGVEGLLDVLPVELDATGTNLGTQKSGYKKGSLVGFFGFGK